jgi:hypothetical protein
MTRMMSCLESCYSTELKVGRTNYPCGLPTRNHGYEAPRSKFSVTKVGGNLINGAVADMSVTRSQPAPRSGLTSRNKLAARPARPQVAFNHSQYFRIQTDTVSHSWRCRHQRTYSSDERSTAEVVQLTYYACKTSVRTQDLRSCVRILAAFSAQNDSKASTYPHAALDSRAQYCSCSRSTLKEHFPRAPM